MIIFHYELVPDCVCVATRFNLTGMSNTLAADCRTELKTELKNIHSILLFTHKLNDSLFQSSEYRELVCLTV